MSEDILEVAAKRRQRKTTSSNKDEDILDGIQNVTISKDKTPAVVENESFERPRTSRRSRTRTSDSPSDALFTNDEKGAVVPFIFCKCNGHEIRAMVDTSSPVSLINKESLNICGFTPDQVESGKFGALNSGSHILGKIKNVDITVEGKTVYANLMVADSGPDVCLGVDFMMMNKCLVSFPDKCLSIGGINGTKAAFLQERDLPLKYRAGKVAASI